MKWIKLFDLNSYFSGAAVSAAGYAAAGAAVVSAAAGVYSASEQKKAAEEQEQLMAQASQDALEQEQRIFEQQAIDAENAGQATVEFGTVVDEEDETGTYDDFLAPVAPSTTGLGGTNKQIGLTV